MGVIAIGPTERLEEAQIEVAVHHPSTVEYKLARIAFLDERRAAVMGEIRLLRTELDDLSGQVYVLDCEISRRKYG